MFGELSQRGGGALYFSKIVEEYIISKA